MDDGGRFLGLRAVKSVWQHYTPPAEVFRLLELFRIMVNDSIRIGLFNNASSLKRLSVLAYNQLSEYNIPSYYKLCAISRASGILAARKKSLRRGYPTRQPYNLRPVLVSCYGFKINNNALDIPLKRGKRLSIPLTPHMLAIISHEGVTVRSFTLTENKLSLCIAREASIVECVSTVGVDRNLRNLTVGNDERIVQYNLSRTVKIAEMSSRIISSFKRNDHRIRGKIASKYGERRRDRTQHLLHSVTRQIVVDLLNGSRLLFSRILRELEGSIVGVTVKDASIGAE